MVMGIIRAGTVVRVASALAALYWICPLPAAQAQVVDPSTMTNKLLAGYQGWFSGPGDGNDPSVGWNHWSRSSSDIGPGLYTVEMWPDVSEYDPEELFPAPNVMLLDGSTGQLFSSRTLKTTERHFKWMKEHGIDGITLQRFIAEFGGPYFQQRNVVLENAGSAATTHGRVFTLEYDISGESTSSLYNDLTQDWAYLVNTYDITHHPRYLHHNGKPVVAIWGLGFSDRPGTPAIATQIINFFKNDPVYGGNYMIGGVPEGWRTLTGSSLTDPAWAAVYRSWNVISPWTVGRYSTSTSSINSYRNNFVVPDLTECNSLGIGYLQVFWPGFSWDNLMQLPPGTSNIPRNGGQFFWDQCNAFQSAGVSMMKVAMFDEEDEGTAILKISQNHPTTDHWVDYGTLPHDWYMRLAGSAGRMLRHEMIPANSTLSVALPIDPTCGGDEVSFNLGEDVADRMTHPQPADGDTVVVANQGGLNCRRNLVTSGGSADLYFYFAVADSFAFQGSQHELCVTMDYYDTGTASLRLQYDSDTGSTSAAIYKDGGSVTLGNTNKWKRKIFHVTDAYFGNRQNSGADFRINRSATGSFYIDRILVTSALPKPPVIQLSASSLAHTITRGAQQPGESFTLINMGAAALNYTAGTNAGWLSVTPPSGRSTGERDTLSITYNTSGLSSGQYSAAVSITDATASNSPQNITVNLNVITYGDLDGDGDVDQADFGDFQACMSGFGNPLAPGCEPADSNSDNSVDATDFLQFLTCMKGPNNPPGC